MADSQRLGAEGQGWDVSITTLMNERLAAAWHNLSGVDDLFDYCCALETPHGPAIEDRDFTIATIVAPSGLKAQEGDTETPAAAEGEGEENEG